MQIKKSLLILTLSVGTTWLMSQITVTNATFPAAGDSLKTATSLNPQGISISPPGGPYTWDFSTLTPSSHQVTAFQAASNGAAYSSFPGSELVVITDAGTETYYDVSATIFATMGISGSDLAGGFPIEAELIITPPLPERHAPLKFFDLYNSTSNATFSFPTSALPGGLLDSLGIPSGLLDSIRLRLNIQRLDIVDAFGMLTIPGGTYEVLREKRTDYTSTAIDVHTLLGWVDISQFIGTGGEQLGIGTDTITTFNFISNTAKEPIAIMTVSTDLTTVEQIELKDNSSPSAIGNVIEERPEVVVSPNPVSGSTTFNFKNIVGGSRLLRLFDTYGYKVFEKELNSDQETISMESLSSGVYVYQVTDGKNKIIATGKLLKVNR
jgi:hypothetical protein